MMTGLWHKLRLAGLLLASPLFAQSGLLPERAQHEVKLVDSLFVQTNSAFDRKLLRIVDDTNSTLRLSFQIVNCVFFYPIGTGDVLEPYTELGIFNDVVRDERGIRRERSSRGIKAPFNFVRVIAPTNRTTIAEVHMLIKVQRRKDENSTYYIWKQIGFLFKDGWKEQED